MQSLTIKNTGSTARDFCFLERNLLSHLKLALLFSILSSSLILHARLVPESGDQTNGSNLSTPLSGLEFAASVLAIVGGLWEYFNGYRDLLDMRAFLAGTKPHLAVMVAIVAVILVTCVILLTDHQL
ncbi:hypothetical protein EV361DRAFT_790220 [Lentinula raphanica]|uniref:DUF202 domain-containing protein n=1 Tax=Lentinula raphanica TaxID=153919 RepID=A0AA38PK46_9AGAR|nr:hypothetical protein EV360DRAFT_46672 [Lentinula raphanica]KAJ3775981.1 hypothetical protein FB446DRAFT_723068 [Lentinula raphanica]KAJ3823205.1 hypothetical protein F5880DRAFT_1718827 [Lentinula raphanica]KAJ3843966.1 hypothetical protein F5878DRAFT_603262 [Lentinula raphanica]KAJ3976441.1 hypothetical protein EV361DRAFT_790220 [Lentinula raphanica]